jgi:hypothetical protein
MHRNTQRGMVMFEALLAPLVFCSMAAALLSVSSQAVNQRRRLMDARCAVLFHTVSVPGTNGGAHIERSILYAW